MLDRFGGCVQGGSLETQVWTSLFHHRIWQAPCRGSRTPRSQIRPQRTRFKFDSNVLPIAATCSQGLLRVLALRNPPTARRDQETTPNTIQSIEAADYH